MSYCRWSSNDYRCDVYVYESEDGWQTHVATRRHTLTDADLPPPLSLAPRDEGFAEAWCRRSRRVSDQLSTAERVPIGLPHDGQSFRDDNPEDCAQRLIGLRDLGYNVPQHAINALLEDAAVCR